MLVICTGPPPSAPPPPWRPEWGCWPTPPLHVVAVGDGGADATRGALAGEDDPWALVTTTSDPATIARQAAAVAEGLAIGGVDVAVVPDGAVEASPDVCSGRHLWARGGTGPRRAVAACTALLRDDPDPPAALVSTHLGTAAADHGPATVDRPADGSHPAVVVDGVSDVVAAAAGRALPGADVVPIERAAAAVTPGCVVVVAHRHKDVLDTALRGGPTPSEVWVDTTDADWSRSMRWIPGRDRLAPGSPRPEPWRI